MKLILFILLTSAAGAQSLPLPYSTYFGGDGSDVIASVASDRMGNVYACGFTFSSNLPVTPGAFQSKHAGVPGTVFSIFEAPPLPDAFVAKFSPSGALIYATYLGGKDYDSALSIAVDASGNAIVAGQTKSANFPVTLGALKTTPPAGTTGGIFIAKLNPAGTGLVFATFFGGSGEDSVTSIATDSAGMVYLTGGTKSGDFPVTTGALGQGSSGGVFAAKLSADGSSLLYSAILGGTTNDSGTGIAVDEAGNAYVAGYTSSTNFPVTAGAFQKHSNATLFGFVSKLNDDASALLYSTLLSGSDVSMPRGRVAIDAAGEVALTGLTIAKDFPVTDGAFQKTLAGSQNAFVTKFNATLSALVFSTYLGGTGDDQGVGIVEDATGNVWAAGSTNSTDFPITTPELARAFAGSPCISRGGSPFGNPPIATPCFDAFTTKFDPVGNMLQEEACAAARRSRPGFHYGRLHALRHDAAQRRPVGQCAHSRPKDRGVNAGRSPGQSEPRITVRWLRLWANIRGEPRPR
jgi:Beta-propeller repeat